MCSSEGRHLVIGCGQRLIAEQPRSQRIILSEGELVAPNQGSLRAIDPLLRQSPDALLQV